MYVWYILEFHIIYHPVEQIFVRQLITIHWATISASLALNIIPLGQVTCTFLTRVGPEIAARPVETSRNDAINRQA